MPRTVKLAWTKVGTSDNPVISGTNFQYLGTALGILNVMQLLLGAVCIGIVSNYWGKNTKLRHENDYHYAEGFYKMFAELFFFTVAVISFVCTFCLLTACVVSVSTASMVSKTVYDMIMHSVACVLYIVAAILYFVTIYYEKYIYDNTVFVVTAALGTVIAVLYLLSLILTISRSNVQLIENIIC